MFAASPTLQSDSGRPTLSVLHRLVRALRPGLCMLDVETLPEHLKRDLGLASGRAAPPRDPLRD